MTERATNHDLEEVFKFVMALPGTDPNTARADNIEEALQPVWNRYNLEPGFGMDMTQSMARDILLKLGMLLNVPEFRAVVAQDLGEDPDSERFGHMFLQASITSALMQVFIVGCEFARRWILPQMLSDALSSLEEITNVGE